MDRKKFMGLLATAGTLAMLPVRALAGVFTRDKTGFKIASGKDRAGLPLSLMEGDTFYTKVAGTDTDNDLYIFESTRVKEGGPSYHIHDEQDEWWYVLEGDFLFRVGGKDFTAAKGDFVFGPRGVPHAFHKNGEGEARLLMGFQPAGKMEAFFKLASEGKLKNATEQEREALRNQHGFHSVGPPIKHLKI
ncbi:MAG: cupin domain-containing protein [Chitinophagaceae bacterium]|nr:MAG: cupin domain-containing protein [Chitinophagaceae bacterium]